MPKFAIDLVDKEIDLADNEIDYNEINDEFGNADISGKLIQIDLENYNFIFLIFIILLYWQLISIIDEEDQIEIENT